MATTLERQIESKKKEVAKLQGALERRKAELAKYDDAEWIIKRVKKVAKERLKASAYWNLTENERKAYNLETATKEASEIVETDKRWKAQEVKDAEKRLNKAQTALAVLTDEADAKERSQSQYDFLKAFVPSFIDRSLGFIVQNTVNGEYGKAITEFGDYVFECLKELQFRTFKKFGQNDESKIAEVQLGLCVKGLEGFIKTVSGKLVEFRLVSAGGYNIQRFHLRLITI